MDIDAVTVPPRWIHDMRDSYFMNNVETMVAKVAWRPFDEYAALANRVAVLWPHTWVKVPTSTAFESRCHVMAQMVAECQQKYILVVGNSWKITDVIGGTRGLTAGELASGIVAKDHSMFEFGAALREVQGFAPSLRMYVSCEYVRTCVRTYVRTYIIVFFRIACQKFSLCFVSRVAIIVGQLFLSGGCENAWKENKSTIVYMGNKGKSIRDII